MKCKKCYDTAIIEMPSLCKSHFTEYFEEKVKRTIEEFGLLEKNDKVCVAASGGKDSVTLLYLLKKFGYEVEALAVNEGIHGYRDHTLSFLKKFCDDNKILLRIHSYEEETGKRLDKMVKPGSPACNTCGTLRRHVLNKYSEGYDKIATGHNMDDESQAVLMNLLKAQKKIFYRQGPKTNKVKGFTQKIKPFYFLREKEIMVYSFIKNINVSYTECPFARLSYRSKVRDALNEYESRHPGTKERILRKYLSIKHVSQPKAVSLCSRCGFPASGYECKACRIKESVVSQA